MRNKFIIVMLIVFSLSALCIPFFCTNNSKTTLSRTEKDFIAFTDSIFKSELEASAFNLHFYLSNPDTFGIKASENIIGNIDYDSMKDSSPYYLAQIEALSQFDYSKLSEKSKVTYDIFLHYLRNELDFSDLCLYYQPLSPTVGVQAQLPVLLSQYDFTCENDVITYLNLLKSVPSYFDDIISFEKIKAENECFLSACVLHDILEQCKSFTSQKDNFLLDTFAERINKLSISDKKKADYININKTYINDYIFPAYTTLIDSLSALKPYCTDDLGLCHFPNGKNYYSYLVRTSTGSDKTVSQIENMINTTMNTDLAKMALFSHEGNLENSLNSLFNQAPTQTPTEMLNELMQKIEKDFPKPVSDKFTVEEVPDSLSAHLSPAFYISPPIDTPDNNIIYINNYNPLTDIELFTTLAHEGYPGHLYQTNYFADLNPPLLRHILDVGGYTEGWATYVEYYSYKYRIADKNLAGYMQASSSYTLALYCLADIGINYHGWNLDETISFFSEKGILDKKIVTEIYNTMLAEPANYLKYYVGYLEILNLKTLMQQCAGDSYSDYNFHTFMLNIGPAPFAIIEKNLLMHYSE